MNELTLLIQKERERLEQEIALLRQKQKNYPKGRLKINKRYNRVQFCLQSIFSEEKQKNPEDQGERYIYLRKDQDDLIDALVQRDYEKKLLKNLETRFKSIGDMPEVYKKTDLNSIFANSHPERRKRIKTEYLPDDVFAAKWESMAYKGKAISENVPEIYTAKGERVRSKSEKILADLFERNHIPYRYEYPLELAGGNVIYPDFTLLNKRTRKEYYLEHLGMMDDPQYAENALKRIALYEKHGLYPGEKLLITSETRNTPLNTSLTAHLINHYLL